VQNVIRLFQCVVGFFSQYAQWQHCVGQEESSQDAVDAWWHAIVMEWFIDPDPDCQVLLEHLRPTGEENVPKLCKLAYNLLACWAQYRRLANVDDAVVEYRAWLEKKVKEASEKLASLAFVYFDQMVTRIELGQVLDDAIESGNHERQSETILVLIEVEKLHLVHWAIRQLKPELIRNDQVVHKIQQWDVWFADRLSQYDFIGTTGYAAGICLAYTPDMDRGLMLTLKPLVQVLKTSLAQALEALHEDLPF